MVKLNSENYLVWKTLMEDILYSKDLYELVEGDKAKLAGKTEVEWTRMKRKIVALIKQRLNLSVYPHVDKETNAQSLWKKLVDLYERMNVKNKAFMIQKLVNMKYKESDSMPEHLSSFQEIVNHLTTTEITLSDKL